ncbi:Wzz/FepE/Etk N-terminal domain-containing protein [Moorellaceae bacterium AZ2]
MDAPLARPAYHPEEEVDLRDLVLALWRQRRLIILVTLLALLASVLFSLFTPAVYRVEALVELDGTDPQSLKPNEGKEVLESRALLAQALDQLSLKADPSSFKPRGEIVKDTNYIKFSLEGRDPEETVAVAEKMLALFVEKRNQVYNERRAPLEENLEQISRDLEQGRRDREKVQAIIAGLEKESLGDIERQLYALQLSLLQGMQAQERVELMGQYLSLQDKLSSLHPARVIDGVSRPEKVRPRLVLNVALSVVLGLMAGTFLALGRTWWSQTPAGQVTESNPQCEQGGS